ncbi:MAG: hypothetical protein DRP51_10785, partial [Candidatus Zixiibacteriota bacterium]
MKPTRRDRKNRKSSRDTGIPRSLVGRALSRVNRYSEILSVLIRFGFADLVRKIDIDVYRRLRGGIRYSRKAKRVWSRPERMRRAFEELGPAFVKIGQLLSHRPDILPPDWIREFEKLRSTVPPVDEGEISLVVEDELGRPPGEIFTSFDPIPIASASIAQVHRAFLPTEGDTPEGAAPIEVAVKIQRPGIRRVIETDLAILRDLSRIAEWRIPVLASFHPVDAVRELDRALRSE